uniref:Uncharacterized protein n=1 Tax=Avena sativa TaxID=4498 RepID=A0ACD5V3Z9_AVESA
MKLTTGHLLPPLFCLTCIFLLCVQTFAADRLEKGQNLTDADGETLVSPSGSYTLGFFSPGASTKRYLGIWFSVSNDTVYWVANRKQPLDDRSGMLLFNDAGSLLLLDGSRRTAWSSGLTGDASAVAAELLESGNLVVRNGSSDVYLWQSFDNPCDTLLPGMKLGQTFWNRAKWELTAWRSADDPSPGDYRRTLETAGMPELMVWRGSAKTYRTGPWNALHHYFNGVPEVTEYSDMYRLDVTISSSEKTYGYTALPGASLTRVVVNHTGHAQRLVWDASRREWISLFKGPNGDCDNYAMCGPFGLCNAANAAQRCGCLPGFNRNSSSSAVVEYADGCRREADLNCTTDRFMVVPGVKLPDTQNASVTAGVTLEECKTRCQANCSCLAYAAANMEEGSDRTDCIIWTDTIVDVRFDVRGENLYLRLSNSEFDDPVDPDGGKSFPIVPVVASVASAITVLLVVFLILWRRRRRILGAIPENPSMEVHSVNLATIKHITGNFSGSNIIGQGGFSVVYKAQLAEGRIIAVKRLKQSALTRKGKKDFAREVEVMAGLRHGSLLRLLAYYNQGKERILVYEYMQNKSLNIYIFGTSSLRASLNWARRLEIIHGIAEGVAYLHGGSGQSVIHRDLKPGNILLDNEWKAKIADFGTAKLFAIDETGSDQTIVVSPGYAAPEYEHRREMTLKCDVYSFGVIILETLSGQRNDST